jgi:hypothetical protein
MQSICYGSWPDVGGRYRYHPRTSIDHMDDWMTGHRPIDVPLSWVPSRWWWGYWRALKFAPPTNHMWMEPFDCHGLNAKNEWIEAPFVSNEILFITFYPYSSLLTYQSNTTLGNYQIADRLLIYFNLTICGLHWWVLLLHLTSIIINVRNHVAWPYLGMQGHHEGVFHNYF